MAQSRAAATPSGRAYGKISTVTGTEQIRVQVEALNGAVRCEQGYVPNTQTTFFYASAFIPSGGTATVVGYDMYSNWKNVTCDPESQD